MPDKEVAVARSGADFLATVTPGFYILTTGAFVRSIMAQKGDANLVLLKIEDALTKQGGQWNFVLGLALLLLAHMLGSAARAISVNWTDRRWWWSSRDHEPFPYPSLIREVLRTVPRGSSVPD